MQKDTTTGEYKTIGFSFMYWVIPFTGWGTSYKFIKGQNFTRISMS